MAPSHIAIIGLGLIGASMGLALRRIKGHPRILGFDPDHDKARSASKALDCLASSAAEAARDASLVVIATPVRAIPTVLVEIAEVVQPGCVVTDTGSTKTFVLREARRILPPEVAFVGGHPMTGKLTAGGVAEPVAHLFDGSVYCVIPSEGAPDRAVKEVVDLVQSVGARPYFVGAEEHDSLVAAISHLPYLLSCSLVNAVAGSSNWREMAAMAAGGFATASRLAEGDPTMYGDICMTNSENVLRYLDLLIQELADVRHELARMDESLVQRFRRAQDSHHQWAEQQRAQSGPA